MPDNTPYSNPKWSKRPKLMITSERAYLALGKVAEAETYLSYPFASYKEAYPGNNRWHRTLEFVGSYWLELGGDIHASPSDAFHAVLAKSDRPTIPLPALFVASFLAYVPDPHAESQRALFLRAAEGVTTLLTLQQPSTQSASSEQLSREQVQRLAHDILESILRQEQSVPWPAYDVDGLAVLLELAAYVWTFPPDVVRRLVVMMVDEYEAREAAENEEESDTWQGDEEESDTWEVEDEFLTQLTPAALVRSLSVPQYWLAPELTVRSLAVRMPGQNYLLLWEQALVLMHPDAPPIDDTDLAWLCEGTLGYQHEPVPIDFLHPDLYVEQLGVWRPARIARISALRQEAEQGLTTPNGRWTFQVTDQYPVLAALGVYTVRLVASSNGFWVRLVSHPKLWGRVLWWQPQGEPPVSLPFVLRTTRTSLGTLSLHEALWQLWRDLRILGTLSLPNTDTHE